MSEHWKRITDDSLKEIIELLNRDLGSFAPVEGEVAERPRAKESDNPYRVQLHLTVGQVGTLIPLLKKARQERIQDLEHEIETRYDLATDLLTLDFPIMGKHSLKAFIDDGLRRFWVSTRLLTLEEVNATIEDHQDRWNDMLSDKR